MRGHIRLFLLLLAAAALPASAGDEGAEGAERTRASETAGGEATDSYRVAPVAIDHVTLFRVRGISARPAKERADDIAVRIVEIARDKRIPADAIKVEERSFGSSIVAGEQVLLCAAKGAEGLRDHIRAECILRPACRHEQDLHRSAPQHPRCLQRVPRANHDPGL